MLTQHIALVAEANRLTASDLAWVSAALQKQVTRDLSPVWGISATVDVFPHLDDVPLGYWPIVISVRQLGSRAGVHIDKDGQPYAQVEASPNWSIAASRACLEMLVNPVEHRTIVSASPREDQTPVELLVEVCGPCDERDGVYTVNDVAVSDFCTPAFFGAVPAWGERYSFSGSLTAPLQVRRGGHLTWHDPLSDNWWLRSHWGVHPIDTRLGSLDKRIISVREFVQACSVLRSSAGALAPEAPRSRVFHGQASQLRAQRLRALPDVRLDGDLEAALSFLQSRQDEPDRPREEPGLDVLIDDVLSDEEEAATRVPPVAAKAGPEKSDSNPRRATIPPPLPATPEPAADEPLTYAEHAASPIPPFPMPSQLSSIPPVVWTLPPGPIIDRRKPGSRSVVLLVGGVLAGGLIALSWSSRSAVVRSTTSSAPIPAPQSIPVASAPVSALPSSAVTPTVKVPAVPAATVSPVPQAAPTVPQLHTETVKEPAHRPPAQEPSPRSGTRHAPRSSAQDLPSPDSAPAERPHDVAKSDPIEALIDTRR